ncbi:MAG: DUF819 family protein [Pseudomarimonas sp.]
MIESAPIFLAVLLLLSGGFSALESATRWPIFKILPPIVLIYLSVTALAVGGAWQVNEPIAQTQTLLTKQLLPALLFLLLATCDLRAIIALGPRLLAAFACTTLSILLAFVLVYVLLGSLLGSDAPLALASLSGGWIGGTANLLAVKQAVALPDSALTQVLIADAVCYAAWVMLLFAAAPHAQRFNAWIGAEARQQPPAATAPEPGKRVADSGSILLWLGMALLIGAAATWLAAKLPQSDMLSATSWTLLLVTVAGLICARTPLAKLPGSAPLGSALLAVVVAALASQSTFAGLASAPLFVLAGFCILAVHAALMLLLAKLFRFDLFAISVSSLANIGGVASAPLLAALHSPALAPVGVLLAMLGYVLGTGLGIALAPVLQSVGIALGYL